MSPTGIPGSSDSVQTKQVMSVFGKIERIMTMYDDEYDDTNAVELYKKRAYGGNSRVERLKRGVVNAKRRHNLLNQSETWINREDRYVKLDDMSARYAENVWHWLEDNADSLKSEVDLFITFSVGSEMASDDEPVIWIQKTPLYRALFKASTRPF